MKAINLSTLKQSGINQVRIITPEAIKDIIQQELTKLGYLEFFEKIKYPKSKIIDIIFDSGIKKEKLSEQQFNELLEAAEDLIEILTQYGLKQGYFKQKTRAEIKAEIVAIATNEESQKEIKTNIKPAKAEKQGDMAKQINALKGLKKL